MTDETRALYAKTFSPPAIDLRARRPDRTGELLDDEEGPTWRPMTQRQRLLYYRIYQVAVENPDEALILSRALEAGLSDAELLWRGGR